MSEVEEEPLYEVGRFAHPYSLQGSDSGSTEVVSKAKRSGSGKGAWVSATSLIRDVSRAQ